MATPPIKGDQQLVKNINRMALLRLLREHNGIARADLTELSGLTRSTVSVLIKDLIEEGWLVEGDAHATGAIGRRPTPLGLDGTRLVLLGADLGPDAIRVAATSIRGELLASRQLALRSKDPDRACRQLVEMALAIAGEVTARGERLLGLGVGLHGAIDKRSGVLEFAPNIGWRQVEVGRRLRGLLDTAGLDGVPVYLQNEADLAAVGESEFGDRPVDDPLVYVSCGVGVGAGIILNEALFTGVSGSAGEIGHSTLVIHGAACSCGRLGCAEAYIGLKAIAAAAGCLQGAQIQRRALRERMDAGDKPARAAFARAGASLGVLLQNVWTTFNPQAIVLGGETVSLGGSALLDATMEVLAGYVTRAGMPPPAVRMAKYGDLATAVGGAAYLLHATLHPHQPALHTRYVTPA
ncbi:MAG: ROK family transcriptional regulator [Proteobacteria bacterium]|nr:ROK family transcriptional regulator [Pseudomonadota bacterium]